MGLLPWREFVPRLLVLYGTLQSNKMQSKNFGARTVHRSNWSNQMPVQKSKPLVRPYRDGRRPRSKAPTGGRPETVEQRRERIVRMAAPLFLEKGYDNVSIDQIIGVV